MPASTGLCDHGGCRQHTCPNVGSQDLCYMRGPAPIVFGFWRNWATASVQRSTGTQTRLHALTSGIARGASLGTLPALTRRTRYCHGAQSCSVARGPSTPFEGTVERSPLCSITGVRTPRPLFCACVSTLLQRAPRPVRAARITAAPASQCAPTSATTKAGPVALCLDKP